MDAITIREIVDATSGQLLSGKEDAVVTGVCTDSRIFQQGDLFVALLGETTDAHRFVRQVAEQGGKTFLISERDAAEALADANVILVQDTLEGLQALTHYYLDKIGVGKIAVTGSVGKTSTRDMVYYILSEKYKTGRPIKNYNSDVGIPLTVFTFDSTTEMAVLEEGMEHAGEIHRLADMTRPEVAIITNVGISHLENLGSRENIYRAKMEITDFFGRDNVLIINESCDLLKRSRIHGDYRVITVGETGAEDYVVSDIRDMGLEGVNFTLTTGGESREFRLNVPGAHNALNAALAVAACARYGVTMDQAAEGLLKLQLTGKRLKVREARGIRVLDDSYNAAPDSVKSAIRTMEATPAERRVAILGAMNELGDDTPALHYEVGKYAAEHGISLVIGIEPKAAEIVRGAREAGCNALYFGEKEDLYPELPKLLKEGDLVLTKASMTRHFWEIADKIING
ncbi:MAG: UDP-N-acetylmuramoyl-tripeptide--D-alanyl-D-alanine ligase [Hornefia butyriciproducens]|uniref:UDP-N-acetylmuramoyl-tripeptide--D-alanyl-D- alanine ligase n=1 Tax=Hornefia butyriciproducens TaxID=2652293 RepID=UPI002A757481|nr:UDP-N-acetylmuramoyl-tripeptide--D-alanyl-D-alanine ligase [Hornefia butyriciproducens]MCI7326851.1 UDP-N-acetylmuramoyl-tripeptide--D-alanyl-D-alanine ligase [Clostridiales bacterium]MDY2990056.1 UDP-N-acetylmuramoyl-tripeptide--D-alanyl-D-alanine ligase [Hornefia butyriciproducens]